LDALRSSAGNTGFGNFSCFSPSFDVNVFGLVVHRAEIELVFAKFAA
jgi:hypothetical protein